MKVLTRLAYTPPLRCSAVTHFSEDRLAMTIWSSQAIEAGEEITVSCTAKLWNFTNGREEGKSTTR